MIVICVYVPQEHLSIVTEAMFVAGAGKIGNYSQCCFFSEGIGQFLPLADSTPAIGQKLVINQVNEWRLEVLTSEEHYEHVISAMLTAHPYEEPAWHAYRSLGKSF